MEAVTKVRRPRHRRRAHFVHGDTITECGAACLCMVLDYWGRTVPIAECHEACGVGRSGASAKNILAAAESYGLEGSALSVGIDDLSDLPTPAILHWGFNHFVVLEGRRLGTATILDPAAGRRQISSTELRRQFTGVAMVFEPGENFERGKGDAPSPWKTLGKSVWATPKLRRLMAVVAAVSVLLLAFGLITPAITKVLVDQVLPNRLDGVLPVIAAGILLIVGIRLASGILRSFLLVGLASRADAQLMTAFFERLLDLPYSFFQNHSVGDLNQRLSSNAQIRSVLTTQVLGSALDGMLVIVYGVVLMVVNVPFALVTIALGVFQAMLLILPARRLTLLTTQELTEVGKTGSFLIEALTAVDTVKASGVEPRMKSRFAQLLTDQINATMRLGRFTSVLSGTTATLGSLSSLVLLFFAAQQVLNGSITLGTMFALIALSGSLLAPMTSLVQSVQALQTVQGHMLRLANVLIAPREQDYETMPDAEELEGRIELRDVSYRYDSTSPWAVRHVSMIVEQGKRVALVGRSGSGKSTIAKILSGLVVPTEGQVLYDDMPLSEVNMRTVRAQCGVVMQSPMVFNGSIRENVTLHEDSISPDQVERALRRAALWEDVERMPMGIETIVSEGGSALSGGQQQRLGIARALARDPKIVVFDEATSHLDAVAEAFIDGSIREREATTVLVAHRLSTVVDADEIIVMEAGSVVQRGTHDSLLLEEGLYADLVSSQTKGGTLDEVDEGEPAPARPAAEIEPGPAPAAEDGGGLDIEGAAPTTREDLLREARRVGLRGRSKMTRAQLESALSDATVAPGNGNGTVNARGDASAPGGDADGTDRAETASPTTEVDSSADGGSRDGARRGGAPSRSGPASRPRQAAPRRGAAARGGARAGGTGSDGAEAPEDGGASRNGTASRNGNGNGNGNASRKGAASRNGNGNGNGSASRNGAASRNGDGDSSVDGVTRSARPMPEGADDSTANPELEVSAADASIAGPTDVEQAATASTRR